MGVVGRLIDAGFARCNTWAVPASVTNQLLIMNTEGFDNRPEMVIDESFSQDFIGPSEVGDYQPVTPTMAMQLRFEQGPDVFLAGAMGSAATPVVVSSQAAGSLVAYEHVLTLSPSLVPMFTYAANFQNYVQEIPSFKVMGFGIKVGAQGRMEVNFAIVGNRTTYDSVINNSATLAGAVPATPGNRAFRRLTRLRMNIQSGNSLTATDEVPVAKEFSLDITRPLAQDFVLNSDGIIEAEDDGFWTGTMQITYARMTSASANSLQAGMHASQRFKADLHMRGTYVNSTTQRSLFFEIPNLQVQTGGYKAVVVGHGQVRPVVDFDLYMPPGPPAGMTSLTAPLRITVVNTRSTNLLA
jgi:hypothetical protein